MSMHEFLIAAVVKAGSKQRKIEASKDGKMLTIWTPKPPENGKANEDVVDIISEHFHVPKSHVLLHKGHGNKRKIFKIMA